MAYLISGDDLEKMIHGCSVEKDGGVELMLTPSAKETLKAMSSAGG